MSDDDEYSETQLKDILTIADEWYGAFEKSPGFARLIDSHQQKAGAIIEFFARYTYEYLGLSPDRWNRAAVLECCTDILPRKVSAETFYFEAVAPVLSAFFAFLDDAGILSNGRKLSKTVAGLSDEIVANSQDRSTWGPAKHLVMAAQEAGVDIEDEGALQAFLLHFNLQQLARSQASAPAKQPACPPSGNPYDPCPCGSGRKYKFCCKPKG